MQLRTLLTALTVLIAPAAFAATATVTGPSTAANGANYTVTGTQTGTTHIQIYKNNSAMGIPVQATSTNLTTSDNSGSSSTSIEVWLQTYALSSPSFGVYIPQIVSAPLIVTINPDSVPPSAPTGLAASQPTSNSLLLTWNAASDDRGAVSYRLEVNGTLLSASIADTIVRVKDLSENTSYSFRIFARDGAGNLTPSTAIAASTRDVTGPSAPGSLQASSISNSGCTLSWTASTDNSGAIQHYQIRQFSSVIATVTGTSTAISGLVPGRTYTYTVCAVDVTGNNSAESNVCSVTTTTPFGAADILISNKTYGTDLVVATSSITAQTNVTVNSGGSVRYIAGNRITLGDGFRANSGSTFSARVGADSTDSDGDGMSDLWELTSGLNPNSFADGQSDADGDGFSNVAEYNLGYDAAAFNQGTASEGGSVPAGWPVPNPTAFEAVGITAGELSVSPSGAATYSVALWAPPGTAGMEPKLTLNYSSQAGAGIAGWGWSLGGVSAITRGPQTMLVDNAIKPVTFTSTDRFYMDGQRLIDVVGAYGSLNSEYRTETESFSRIVAQGTAGNGPESFKVWTKAGLIIEFGGTAGSRLMAGTTVRTWSVSKITDTSGNYMEFVYEPGPLAGEQRIERIKYTGHTGTTPVSPYASVRFEYEDRLDKAMGWTAGYQFNASKRLAAIKACYGETVIRTYKLTYKQRQYTYRSLLESITEIGLNNTELRPLKLEYSEAAAGWTQQDGTWNLPGVNNDKYLISDNKDYGPTGVGFLDFDGDGRTDFLFHDGNSGTATAMRNTGSGWTTASGYIPPRRLAREDGMDAGVRFADVNGDGLVDMLWRRDLGGAIGACLNTGYGWSADQPAWHPPSRVNANVSGRKGSAFMDMDGDGRVDFVSWVDPTGGSYSSYKLYVFKNTGSGFSGVPDANFGSFTFGGSSFDIGDKKPQFVELNGDGLPDLVVYYRTGDGSSDANALKAAWLNTGAGWSWAPQFIPPRYIADNDHGLVGAEFVDVNGDGLVDLTWSASNSVGVSSVGVALNKGATITPGIDSSAWSVAVNNAANGDDEFDRYTPYAPLARAIGSEMRSGATYMDVNGDGMVDALTHYETSYGSFSKNVSLGNGWGFYYGDSAQRLPAPLSFDATNAKGAGMEIVDLNGDGVADVLVRRRNNDGSYVKQAWINNARQSDRLVKVTNGFGVAAELVYKPLTDSSVYTRGSAALSEIDVAERPNVANGTGAMLVVSEVKNDDGAGGTYSLFYSYEGMRAHRRYGSLGFLSTSVLDGRTNILSTTDYNQNFPYVGMPARTETLTNAGGSGAVVLSESATIYDKKLFNSDKTRMVFAKQSVSISRDLDGSITSVNKTVTQQGARGTTGDYDGYGNSLRLEVISGTGFTWGTDLTTDLGTVSATDRYSKLTVNTYDNTIDASRWHLGRLRTSTVTSSGPSVPSITRSSAFTYRAADGLLETEVVEPGTDASSDPAIKSLWAKTTYTYDEFGNKTGVSTAAYTPDFVSGAMTLISRDATAEYDTTGTAPGRLKRKTWNALNQLDEFQYDERFGAVNWHRDPNLIVTTADFDDFGRPKIATSNTAVTATVAQTFRRWAGSGAATPAGALYYVETVATASAPAVEFFDKFGRSIRKVAIDGDGRAVASDTFYDTMGRAYRGSTPFVIGQSPAGYTETVAFDLLNRPLVVRTPDDQQTAAETVTINLPGGGTAQYTIPAGYVGTSFQYNGLVSRVSRRQTQGGARIITRTTSNSQGWEVEVVQNETNVDIDPNSIEQATLTKGYDALGNLTSSTAAGVTIVHTYDRRGRRIGTNDPDMGIWSYEYNGLGELTEQTDAKLQVTKTAYDSLGRPSARKIYNASGTVEERTDWVYDSAPGAGKGKLYHVTTTTAAAAEMYKETYSYDSYGRPTTSTRRIRDDGSGTATAATDYVSGVSYDTYGRVERTIYPTGVTVRHAYNAFSVLKEVRRQLGGSVAANDPVVWMALRDEATDPSVATSRYLLGNGVTTTRTGSRATGRLRMIDTGIRGTSNLQAIDLDYDRAGNVVKRFDTAIGLNDTAFYDALNRVRGFTSAQGTTLDELDVRFDARGNITWKSDVGTYAYGGSRPHAVTGTSGGAVTSTYGYDANGAMTSGMGRTLTYTAFNQTRSITSASSSSIFWFGAGHERVGHKTGAGILIYGSGAYEKFTPTNGLIEHTHYIMTPAGRTASYKTFTGSATTETRYFHTDHLGSITVVTGERGGVVKRMRYDAWGRQLGSDTSAGTGWYTLTSGNNDRLRRGFTDHEHLHDLGLIHMNGRIFDPVLARFLSADPNIDGVSDSQGYNRYSYVHNNPLNATDPSGYLSLKEVLPAIIAIVVTVVVTVATYGSGTAATSGFWATAGEAFTAAGSHMVVGAAAGGFSGGFSGSLLNGGSIGDAFRSGLIGAATGAFTAWAAGGIGNYFDGLKNVNAVLREIGRALSHGTVGGMVTEAQGGEFRHGFYSSTASSAFGHSPVGEKLMASNVAVSTATSFAIGGTVSVLGGGKFANGAVTSAFQHLFNQVPGMLRDETPAEPERSPPCGVVAIQRIEKHFKLKVRTEKEIRVLAGSTDGGMSDAALSAIFEKDGLTVTKHSVANAADFEALLRPGGAFVFVRYVVNADTVASGQQRHFVAAISANDKKGNYRIYNVTGDMKNAKQTPSQMYAPKGAGPYQNPSGGSELIWSVKK